MTRFKTLSSASCVAAALSMLAAPAAAADLPVAASQSSVPMAGNWEPGDEIADRYRRYRHDRGVSAGDVLTGVLIIGGIAAIANSTSRNNDRRRSVEPRYRENYNPRVTENRSIDRAVDTCLRTIERDVRVEAVDSVNRTNAGWDVSGSLYNGDGFMCRIDNNGRIDGVSYGDQTARLDYGQDRYGQGGPDRQYSADQYANAWDRQETRTAQAPAWSDGQQQPSYPGGPLPGEEIYDDGRLGG